jgi:conjugal transfer pilus assembly protein TraK
MTLSNSSPSLFLLPLLLALSSPAAALQILDAKDGETVLGKISQKEVTRISVERGRIRKVTGNTGEFVLEKDEDKGQIFIRPVSPDSTKPINLFITSERSTIGLVLQPVDTPSDTIVIREGRDPLTSTSRMEKSGRHVRTIKNLLLAMAGDALPDDMEVREPTQELAALARRAPELAARVAGRRHRRREVPARQYRQHRAEPRRGRALQARCHGGESGTGPLAPRRIDQPLRDQGAASP